MISKTIFSLSLLIGILLSLQAQTDNKMYYEQNRFVQNSNYNDKLDYYGGISNSNIIERQEIPANPNEMVFTVSGLKNVPAESYVAIFNLIQIGETAQEADQKLNERFTALSTLLTQAGIAKDDISIDMISLIPLYEMSVEKKMFSKDYNEVPAGFEIQKNMHIRYTKAELLDKIITFAAQNEVYDLIKVEYFVNNTEECYTELRDKCLAELEIRLNEYKEINPALDSLSPMITEVNNVAYPIDRYKSYQSTSGTTTSSISRSSGSVTTVRKPTTMFYNKLPYHRFDIIINPEVKEPMVQFTYSVTVKYTIAPQKDKEIYILSPDGNLKKMYIN